MLNIRRSVARLLRSEIGLPPLCRNNNQQFLSTIAEYQKDIDEINQLFITARDEIDYAKEDAETTYFNESFQDAKKHVDDALSGYQSVLCKLEEGERAKLQRSMGLKMEQLRAELDLLSQLHTE